MVQSSAERYQHSPTAAGHVYLYLTTNGFLISAFPEYSCLAFSTPCNIVPQFQFLAVSTPAFWDILVLFPFPLFHVSHFQRPHLAVSCAGTVYIYFLGLLSLTEFYPVQSSLYVQVLHSLILAALLHCTPAVAVSQTLWRGTPYKEWNYGTFAEGATYIQLGGHHVGHRPTF